MNVKELRTVLADLPDDLVVVTDDDLNYVPVTIATREYWLNEDGWGTLCESPDVDNDGDPYTGGSPVPALVLSGRSYL